MGVKVLCDRCDQVIDSGATWLRSLGTWPDMTPDGKVSFCVQALYEAPLMNTAMHKADSLSVWCRTCYTAFSIAVTEQRDIFLKKQTQNVEEAKLWFRAFIEAGRKRSPSGVRSVRSMEADEKERSNRVAVHQPIPIGDAAAGVDIRSPLASRSESDSDPPILRGPSNLRDQTGNMIDHIVCEQMPDLYWFPQPNVFSWIGHLYPGGVLVSPAIAVSLWEIESVASSLRWRLREDAICFLVDSGSFVSRLYYSQTGFNLTSPNDTPASLTSSELERFQSRHDARLNRDMTHTLKPMLVWTESSGLELCSYSDRIEENAFVFDGRIKDLIWGNEMSWPRTVAIGNGIELELHRSGSPGRMDLYIHEPSRTSDVLTATLQLLRGVQYRWQYAHADRTIKSSRQTTPEG